MQFVINAVRLLTAALFITLVGSLIAIIPPKSVPAQSPPALAQDTVLDKAKEFIERVQAVSDKIDYAASMVDSNTIKAQQIVSILDRLKLKNSSTTNATPRVIYKEKPTKANESDKPGPSPSYVERQYVGRPILVFDACRYTYGGDSFRTNMWQPPTSDGYWKPIKKFFQSKFKRNAK